MNEAIIENWNKIVGFHDIVYHLGDIGRNCKREISRLNGDIFYVRGNHDANTFISTAPSIREINILGLLDEYGNQRLIVLCHYAMRSWNKSHYASWHLFGHHHGKLEPYGLSFDVGVDCNDYYPFSLDQIIEKMKTLKPIVDYRIKG